MDALTYSVRLADHFDTQGGLTDAMGWCHVRFGPQRHHFSVADIPGIWRHFIDTEEPDYPVFFYFMHENDAFEFKMHWG